MRTTMYRGRWVVRNAVVRVCSSALLCVASVGCCGSAWTARVCTSNNSGNCRATDSAQPHKYPVKSASLGPVSGTTDVTVREPACTNGMGEVDVHVLDGDNLEVTILCLVDAPQGTMTLPTATTPQPTPPSDGGH
jgi:hypothetical protein